MSLNSLSVRRRRSATSLGEVTDDLVLVQFGLQLVKINYKDYNDMGRIVSNGLYHTADVITHGVYIFYTMWM